MSRSAISPAVVALRDWLDARKHLYVDLLRDLVGIDSCWANPDGVREVSRIVSERLTGCGFDVSIRTQQRLSPEDRWLGELLAPGVDYELLAPTVVARRRGDRAGSLLLLGDLDTAFPGGKVGVPFDLTGDRARGTGIADMKGGLVGLVAALEALQAADSPLPAISVVLAGDEQGGSLGSRRVIRSEASSADWALCVECAHDGGNLMAARGHIGVGLLEVVGVEAHAGTDVTAGVSAIVGAVRFLPGVLAVSNPDQGVLVTPTMINGGRRRSVVPGRVAVVLDLRAADTPRWNQMARALEELVSSYHGPEEVSLRIAAHRPGVSRNPKVDRLIDLVQEVGSAISDVPGAIPSMAAGSSAFAADVGCVVLDGMGPPGGSLMTQDESISIGGMVNRAAILAGTIAELAIGTLARTESSPRGFK